MAKSKITLGGGEALFLTAFLFATTNILVREMAHMWGNQAQLAARFGLVWLLLVAYAKFKGVKIAIPRSKRMLVIIYSILAAVAILFFTLSVQMTSIANTLFTSSATEVAGAFLLGTILLGEKLSGRKLIAIALSLVGLALYSDALLGGNAGLIYGLLAGTTTAFCNLIAKQLKGVNRSAVLRMQFGLGAILAAVLAVIVSPNDILRTVSVEGTAATIVFALILIAATQLILYGFQHFDINIASVILSSQLAFGALLGYLAYREVPAPHEILSGVLIACAAIVASTGQSRSTNDVDVHS